MVRMIVAMAAWAAACSAEIGNIVVTSAANFERGLPWRGSIASVFCTGLRGINGVVAADRFPLPLELAGVRVTIGGAPAPLFAVAELGGFQQINLQVPWEEEAAVDMTIEQAGEQGRVRVSAVLYAGNFFRLADGDGAFKHAADYAPVSRENPARGGEVVIGYLTGLVASPAPPVPTGQPAPADPPAVVNQVLSSRISTPRFQIQLGEPPNQKVVDPLFFGLAPGLVGVYQVNFEVPGGLSQGRQPVRLVENACITMFGVCFSVRRYRVSSPIPMAMQ